ncbi:MAG: saccharopine dehydrogenase NADP-binding domain-containing protein [Spirochaetales bacterium]|nr:saccharopine dehydrogenase NADP-binding domain-containing protein [Spirochaetales bacterium]
MKKVLVLGVGAQGSTIAKRLDEESVVSQLRCGDRDPKATGELENTLKKAKGYQVDARSLHKIVEAAHGVDLIVNGLAPDFNMTVMDAALEVDCDYQDMASGPVSDIGFVEAVQRCLDRSPEFEKKGLTALINTGSAPGCANVVTRESVDMMDECESIEILVYDGIWSKQFIPFWWSPKTAFADMAAKPIRFENGKFVRTKPFDNPSMEYFEGLGKRRMVDHEHEEPVTMGLLSGKVLKNVKNVNFRYGGPAVDLAESLYKMGLLSEDSLKINGQEIVPMDIISFLTPPAPKYPEEIQTVLDGGMELEEGAFVVRVSGKRMGRNILIESYVNAPGLLDSFVKAGITHESYFTGQSAFLFTKMLINDKIDRTGVFPPEMLDKAERDYYFKEASKLDITVDQIIRTRLFES